LPLFKESSLDSILTKSKWTGSELVNSINRFYTFGNKSQFNSSINEIFKQITRFSKLVIIPSGKLNFINFGAFELEDGSVLSDNREISYYNSLSEFLLDEKLDSDFKFDEIDIYAGLNYNSKNTNSIIQSKLKLNNQIVLNNYDKFSSRLRSYNNTWDYLPGSKIEGNSIKMIFEVSPKYKFHVKMFENGNGDEFSFRNLVTSNSKSKILHMATHGFFFDKLDFQNLKDSININNLDNSAFRSGLILSGGNLGWKNFDINKYNDDGILTSYEISKLKFDKVKLVVLSACDTGLGDLQSNEGVFGLQRALKLAGAEKIIMSLWKVPDTQTMELMTYFYENLTSGTSVKKSLAIAQNKMKLKYSPFYWAAFKLLN